MCARLSVHGALALAVAACVACAPTTEGTTTGSVSGEADAGGGAIEDAADGAAASLRLVYTAHRSVSTPWFIPVGEAGPGAAIQLAPRRGAGYGQGEGEVSYPDLTPDGSTVVVAFYPLNTPASSVTNDARLFALSTKGGNKTKPVEIARAKALHATDRAYNDVAMAYVDGASLHVARLDGADAKAPILVATAPPSMEMGTPRWLPDGKQVAYWLRPKSGGSAKGWIAAADGSQAGSPMQLKAGQGDGAYLAAMGNDGRLILRGSDNRLYAATGVSDPKPVVLTPKDVIADYVGLSADGKRIAAVLRTTWQKERQLVSVATDGADADLPAKLTVVPAKSLSALMARDGSAVAWVAQAADGKWAAWQADLGADADGVASRVSAWNTQRLHVTAFLGEAGGLIGARQDGAVLHYLTEGEPGQKAKVLAKVDNVVNHSIPWPTLTVGGTQVIYDANTPKGWRAWVVPLEGGVPQEVDSPWYRDLLTPHGIIVHEYVHEGAAFVSDLSGQAVQRSGWHGSELLEPHLVADGTYLVYGCTSPTPGWYAAHTSAKGHPKAALVMPVQLDGAAKPGPWPARPLVIGGHLVRLAGGRVEAWPLAGPAGAAPRVLALDAKGPLLVDPGSERLLFQWAPPGADNAIYAARVTDPPDAPPLKVMWLQGEVRHMAMLPGTGRLVALLRVSAGPDMYLRLYAAKVDGSEAESPHFLAGNLPGSFAQAMPTDPGSHVLTTKFTEFTAVPHPEQLFATPVPSGPPKNPGVAHTLAPKSFSLWQAPPLPWPAVATSKAYRLAGEAGTQVLLRGPKGLYSALVDGSQADAPRHLSNATEVLGPPLSPKGKRLLLRQGGQAVVVTVGVTDSQIDLGEPDGQAVMSGLWAQDGQRVVLHGGPSKSAGQKGRLFAVDAGATPGKATPLHAADFGISQLIALWPDGQQAIVESVEGWDHSLYRVPLDGSGSKKAPVALTPVDDARERFVGVSGPSAL